MEDNTQQYGLTTTDNTPVPLKKLEVKTEIQGFISSTCYTLTYENEEEKPVEASFVFPMDDSSAIFHFEAEIDGRRIVAECQDKKQAKQTYNDAMAAGQSAFLLAESDHSRDVFKCDVGNLPPKSTAFVRLYYVTELDIQANGALLYVFPVTLFERYELTRQQDATQSKRVKLPRAKDGHIPYELDFNLKVLSPREILSVEFVDETDGKEAQVNNGKEDTHNYLTARIAGSFHWDHDISVKVLYSDPFEPHVISEKGSPNGEGILKLDMVMLNFFPNLEGEETRFAKAELLFIMDRSGSMRGQSMIHAREALLECLKIIPEECIFNIISFGSTFKKLFETSQQADAKNIKSAQAEVRKMEANLGGTEILSPLVDIMASKDTISEYPRQVFLFTDGGVSNSDGVIAFVKENADSTRVFTFGIGIGVSTSLVKGAAHAGKGKCVMVKDTKDLASQASQTLKCAMQPNVDDVAITFAPTVEATFFPSVLPPIFNGERLIAYAVLKNAKKDDLVASLKGRINGRLVHHSLDFTFKEAASDLAPVHRLAAKAAIKQMEEDEDWQNPKKNEIIIMSTAANVVSKYTAFVGVDHQGQKMGTPSVQREIPVAHAPMQASGRGFAHTSGMAMGISQCDMMAAPPPAMAKRKYPAMAVRSMPSMAMGCMMAAPILKLKKKPCQMARKVGCEFQCESATTVRKVKKLSCDFEGDDSTLQTDTRINQKDIKDETKSLEDDEDDEDDEELEDNEELEPNKVLGIIQKLEVKSISDDRPQAQGLAIVDNVTEPLLKFLHGNIKWQGMVKSLGSLNTNDIIKLSKKKDVVLFIIGAEDIRNGMTGLEAISLLMKMIKDIKPYTQVSCMTLPPSNTKGASTHISLFNYEMTKLASEEKSDSFQIINLEYTLGNQTKEVMLDYNDKLSERCIKIMADILNIDVKLPATLKSCYIKDDTHSVDPHITKAVVQLQPNEIGKVIGK